MAIGLLAQHKRRLVWSLATACPNFYVYARTTELDVYVLLKSGTLKYLCVWLVLFSPSAAEFLDGKRCF